MVKKNFANNSWFVIGAVLSLLVIAGLGSQFTGEAIKGGPQAKPVQQFAATSCDADAVCEINAAKVAGALGTGSLDTLDATISNLRSASVVAGKVLTNTFETMDDFIFSDGKNERMRITKLGELGLGTSDPMYNIHIKSAWRAGSPIVPRGSPTPTIALEDSGQLALIFNGGAGLWISTQDLPGADFREDVHISAAGARTQLIVKEGQIKTEGGELNVTGSAIISGQVRLPSYSSIQSALNASNISNAAFACFDANGQLFRSDVACR